LRPSIALQAAPSKGECGDRCMLPPATSEIEQPVRETVRSKNSNFAKYLISLVGPAGLPHSRAINGLGDAETIGNVDIYRCLSHAIVSVFERDDGMWSIGWHDDADGPFQSRRFAGAVAARWEGGHALATS
jgi:hypothetical protein